MKSIFLLLSTMFFVSIYGNESNFKFNGNVSPDTFPVRQNEGSPHTQKVFAGGVRSVVGFIDASYADTTAANANPYIWKYPGARIRTGNIVWMRDATATKWLNITGTVTNLIDNSTRLVYGTATLDTLLTYDVSDAGYFILGNYYTSAATQVTFDAADAALDRIDVIYLNTSGQVGILKGTASVFPVKPTVDASTQIELTFVTISGASTTVDDVVSTVIYNENAEWTGNSDVTGYDLVYATDPYSGSVSVDIPSFAGGEYLDFTNSTSLDITDYQYLKLYIRLHEAFDATDFISVYLLSTETQVTQPVYIINGAYGFNGSTVADYMVVAIPINAFSIVQNMGFNRVRFIFYGASTTGLQIDKVVLHSGYSNPPPTAGGVLSFNGRTGHVLPMFEDYRGMYQDTTYMLGDSLAFSKGTIVWKIKVRDSTKVVDVNGDPSPFFRAVIDSAGYNWLFYDTTGLGGSSGTTYTANAPVDITGSVISVDTSKVPGALATYTDVVTSTNWSKNGIDIYNNNAGNIGIGLDTPASKLVVSVNNSGSALHTNKVVDDSLGVTIANYNAATAGSTGGAYPPHLTFIGSAWNTSTGTSRQQRWRMNFGLATNTSLTGIGVDFQSSDGGDDYVSRVAISQGGALTVQGTIQSGANGYYNGYLRSGTNVLGTTAQNALLVEHNTAANGSFPNNAPPRIFQYGNIHTGSASIKNGIGMEVVNTSTTANYVKWVSQFNGGSYNDLALSIHSEGNVGIGNTSPNAAAKVDIASTTQGLLPPRMTAVQAGAIATPPDGLVVYVSDADATFPYPGLYCRELGTWQLLSNALIPVLSYGTYTPTDANNVNVSAITFNGSQYSQVGEVITVSGEVEITPTATGTYSFTIDLPISSSAIQSYHAGGTGCSGDNSESPCFKILGYAATGDQVQFVGRAVDNILRTYSYSFTYFAAQ